MSQDKKWQGETLLDVPFWRSGAMTFEQFHLRLFAWFPSSYEQHTMLLDELPELPWFRQAVFHEEGSTGAPQISVQVTVPITEVVVALHLSFLGDAFGALWQAKWSLDNLVRRVTTNDVSTLLHFLRGAPDLFTAVPR